MPIEVNLPDKCAMWIDLAFRILEQNSKYDSASFETRLLLQKAQECIENAMAEIEKVKDGENE